MKGGKSGPEKYYQIRSNEYLITCEKSRWQEVKIIGWPGNKYDIQIEKWQVSEKRFHIWKPKKNKFLVTCYT